MFGACPLYPRKRTSSIYEYTPYGTRSQARLLVAQIADVVRESVARSVKGAMTKKGALGTQSTEMAAYGWPRSHYQNNAF
jgi:hypothetical protein